MKYHHLSLDERQIIENGLRDSKTFQSIGLSLGKDSSTISKEIKRHRIFKPRSRPYSPNNCIYRRECDQASTCRKSSQCHKNNCLKCGVCNEFCEKFKPIVCKHLLRGKLVCNGCVKRSGCQKDKYYYYASKAHDQYSTHP